MIAAILSAGKSLTETWPRRKRHPDIVIAVNRALLIYEADWLAAGDRITLEDVAHHRPGIGCWSMRDQCRMPPPGWSDVRMIPFEDFPGWNRLSRPGQWSVQAAVAGAHVLGATAIDVYGHDMKGLLDISGHPGDGRTEHRWQREALDWQATCEWAASQRMIINHIKETNGQEHQKSHD